MNTFKNYFIVLFSIVIIVTVSCSQDEIVIEQKTHQEMSKTKSMKSAKTCQCTEYIANRLELTSYSHAFKWHSTLEKIGYTKVSVSINNPPKNKDIIIFHRDYGNGISRDYGHIGMVATASRNGNNIRVDVVGANQGGSVWTEYNCKNVSIMSISSLILAKDSIYRRN